MARFPPAGLETERLRLRQPTAADAPVVFERYARDPEVTRYLAWTTNAHVGETEAFLERCQQAWRSAQGHRPWAIERREDGRLLGMIGFDVAGHAVSLGYVLAREAWGRGYMTEAVRGVCRTAFADPAVHRVWAVCDVDNAASARVLEKAGMEREGTLRRWMVHPNFSATPRDCHCYALARG